MANKVGIHLRLGLTAAWGDSILGGTGFCNGHNIDHSQIHFPHLNPGSMLQSFAEELSETHFDN